MFSFSRYKNTRFSNSTFLIFFSNAPCTGKRFLVYYAAFSTHGEVAQLVEHHVRNVGVESSNLFFSTIKEAFHPRFQGEAFFC